VDVAVSITAAAAAAAAASLANCQGDDPLSTCSGDVKGGGGQGGTPPPNFAMLANSREFKKNE